MHKDKDQSEIWPDKPYSKIGHRNPIPPHTWAAVPGDVLDTSVNLSKFFKQHFCRILSLFLSFYRRAKLELEVKT